MIRGIVYLTGVVTLTVVGLIAAFAFQVHKWPWKDYVETGRREIAETLRPGRSGDVEPRQPQSTRLDRARRRQSHLPAPSVVEGVSSVAGDVEPVRRLPRPRVPDREPVPLVRRHVVRKDETLYAIAVRYYGAGDRWPEIARANDIRKPADLRPGRAIVVPYGTVAFEDRTDPPWMPDLRLQFAPAAGLRQGYVRPCPPQLQRRRAVGDALGTRKEARQ